MAWLGVTSIFQGRMVLLAADRLQVINFEMWANLDSPFEKMDLMEGQNIPFRYLMISQLFISRCNPIIFFGNGLDSLYFSIIYELLIIRRDILIYTFG